MIHAPNRLQICAMLAAVDSMEFSRARESLGVSDSVLSKHLKVLEGAGAPLREARGRHHLPTDRFQPAGVSAPKRFPRGPRKPLRGLIH
nr:transcriptional regulator [Streptomyces sp. CS090A]